MTTESTDPSPRPDAPEWLTFAVYSAAGAAAVLSLLPCVWLLAVPLSAFGLVGAWYASGKFRRTNTVLACGLVSLLVLLACFAMLSESRYQLKKAPDRGYGSQRNSLTKSAVVS